MQSFAVAHRIVRLHAFPGTRFYSEIWLWTWQPWPFWKLDFLCHSNDRAAWSYKWNIFWRKDEFVSGVSTVREVFVWFGRPLGVGLVDGVGAVSFRSNRVGCSCFRHGLNCLCGRGGCMSSANDTRVIFSLGPSGRRNSPITDRTYGPSDGAEIDRDIGLEMSR